MLKNVVLLIGLQRRHGAKELEWPPLLPISLPSSLPSQPIQLTQSPHCTPPFLRG
jgi:hypothetical protein